MMPTYEDMEEQANHGDQEYHRLSEPGGPLDLNRPDDADVDDGTGTRTATSDSEVGPSREGQEGGRDEDGY